MSRFAGAQTFERRDKQLEVDKEKRRIGNALGQKFIIMQETAKLKKAEVKERLDDQKLLEEYNPSLAQHIHDRQTHMKKGKGDSKLGKKVE